MKKISTFLIFALLLVTIMSVSTCNGQTNVTALRFINGNSTIAGTRNGSVYFDTGLGLFQFRQGDSWIGLAGSGGGSSGSGLTGRFAYWSNDTTLSYTSSIYGLNNVTIRGDQLASAALGQLTLTGSTNTNKRLAIGTDTSGDYGFLQAYTNGSGYKPISLNPLGGNIGIGTSAPNTLLEIVGNANNLILRSTTNTSYSTLRLYNNLNSAVRSLEIDYTGSLYSGGEQGIISTTGAYPLVLGTNNIERVRLTSGGDLGIGTATPSAKLHIVTATGINFQDAIFLEKSGGYGISAIQNYYTDASNYGIGFSVNSATRFVINKNGYLGIGNTVPSEKLDVTGNVRFSGALMPNNSAGTSGQVLTSAGTGTVPTWTTVSGVSGLTSTRVPYATGSTSLADNSAFTFDATNTALTVNSLRMFKKTSGSIFVGEGAGNFTTTGATNTAFGYSSLASITNGQSNTANGSGTLSSLTSGSNNTATGSNSLFSNTTGYQNTSVGVSSLYANTTGYVNTSIGYNSNSSNTTGHSDTAIGSYALYGNTTGINNTALGFSSLYSNTTGSNNVAIGSNIYCASPTSDNQLSIQNIIFGISNSGTGTTVSNGSIGIGLPSPTEKLDVDGNIRTTGKFMLAVLNTAPSSSTATGTLGEIRITATYIYICTATNTWVRASLATW